MGRQKNQAVMYEFGMGTGGPRKSIYFASCITASIPLFKVMDGFYM